MKRFLKVLGSVLLGLGTAAAAASGRDHPLVPGGKTDARIRLPGDKRGFGHESKREAAAVELTATPTAHPFRFGRVPCETEYIDVGFHGSAALIAGVNAARSSH